MRVLLFLVSVFFSGSVAQEEETGPVMIKEEMRDNCIDISRFGPVIYNESAVELCNHKKMSICTPQKKTVCKEIPVHNCSIVGYVNCVETPTVKEVNDDIVEVGDFAPQVCVPGPTKTLTETKQMPVCEKVKKQHCDEKWVINEAGEKVWGGYENCQDVEWDECSLQETTMETEVATWDCQPNEKDPIMYQSVIHQTVEATVVTRTCEPVAQSVCEVRVEEQCEDVEWQDCEDVIVPNCYKSLFRIPYQEYNHLMRCALQY